MTKTREPKRYGIGKNRFREVYYHCLQYNEWKSELEAKTDTVKGREYNGMPSGTGSGNVTEALAIRRAQLRQKMEVIEQTAIETDSELYRYILLDVTNDWVTFNYLEASLRIPCGRTKYYELRRKFYYLLSKKI